jgi:hypothetical protein
MHNKDVSVSEFFDHYLMFSKNEENKMLDSITNENNILHI